MDDRQHDIVISIHILPYELEDYRRIINQLNTSALQLPPSDRVFIHTTLNINEQLTDWKHSCLSKSDTIDIYREINESSVYNDSLHEIDGDILGVNDHRRNSIQTFTSLTRHMSFIDCDLHFNTTHLRELIKSLNQVSQHKQYYIISPQVVKLWDNTWNCLVNKQYKTKSFTYHKTTDPRTIINNHQGKFSMFPLNRFKWGGGLFNGFSMNLLTYVGVPDTFIGYGRDVTYTMECAMMMSKYGYSVKQYVLKNSIVMEDYININKPFKNNFKVNDIRNKLLKQIKTNYRNECNLFLTKVRQTPYI